MSANTHHSWPINLKNPNLDSHLCPTPSSLSPVAPRPQLLPSPLPLLPALPPASSMGCPSVSTRRREPSPRAAPAPPRHDVTVDRHLASLPHALHRLHLVAPLLHARIAAHGRCRCRHPLCCSSGRCGIAVPTCLAAWHGTPAPSADRATAKVSAHRHELARHD